MARIPDRCAYCGRKALAGFDVCGQHLDLAEAETGPLRMSFCTRTPDCIADVADHDDECPVEHELRKVFGF